MSVTDKLFAGSIPEIYDTYLVLDTSDIQRGPNSVPVLKPDLTRILAKPLWRFRSQTNDQVGTKLSASATRSFRR
jgi:hypothetical protein